MKETANAHLESDRMLQISGEWKEKDVTRRYKFSFSPPENVNVDMVNTSVENDVLIVTLPKFEVM